MDIAFLELGSMGAGMAGRLADARAGGLEPKRG
jgi:3-hydroxyisobutyrate dehydrogenase-like beta-hydroxyacid dehydrogenase